VIEERMPPGAREARHRHAAARQFFYVLSGVLTMEVEGTVHRLAERSGIEIAPAWAHQALTMATQTRNSSSCQRRRATATASQRMRTGDVTRALPSSPARGSFRTGVRASGVLARNIPIRHS
jgi:hypothetical protein